MPDEYKTVKAHLRTEIKVRGSRFIADVYPVNSVDDVAQHLASLRGEFHDATHHCYAYRMGPEGAEYRWSDGGEPAGTAGKPILAMIDKYELLNVLVVVTRYFGGTKLGAGGLVRAYGGAAESVLVKVEKTLNYSTRTVIISFPHEQTGNVMHVLSKTGAKITDTTYDEDVHLQVKVRASLMEELGDELLNATSGNIEIRNT